MKTKLLKSSWVLVLIFILSGSPQILSAADSSALPPHVAQAEMIVQYAKSASTNVYAKGHRNIDWIPSGGNDHTVCSSFIVLLLEHVYGWKSADMRQWMGSSDPDAGQIYDVISAQNGFAKISKVSEIMPGDFLSIKYFDASEDTGHIMMVDQAPVQIPSSAPVIPNTVQYSVQVIDSSESGHGHTDTRFIGHGKYTGGIGEGIFRIYADLSGQIAGYTWSTQSDSKYYQSPARVLIVGRLTRSN